jgi:hypothetical protein
MNNVNGRLADLRSGRDAAMRDIESTCRTAGVGALLLIGSLGRGQGDSFSDLDLIAVVTPDAGRVDLEAVFGRRVLTVLDKPRNAPVGGGYRGVCLDVGGLPLWVDWYAWPAATARTPADAGVVYDNLGVPASDLDFIPLLDRHRDPEASGNPDPVTDALLRVAVAAKYLARGDLTRLATQLPAAATTPADELPALLHSQLHHAETAGQTRAVTATRHLIDLAADCWNRSDVSPDLGEAADRRFGTVEDR